MYYYVNIFVVSSASVFVTSYAMPTSSRDFLRLHGKLSFPYNCQKWMVQIYVTIMLTFLFD